MVYGMRGKCSFLASPETGDLYYIYGGWRYDGISGKVYEIGDKYYYVKGVSYNAPDDCEEIGQDVFYYCCSKNGTLYCRNQNMVYAGTGRIYYYKLRPIACQRQAKEEYDKVMNAFNENLRRILRETESETVENTL